MIILCGPSATGKTEIAKALFNKYGIKKFVTTTTREKRVGEKDNIDYHFITKEKFQALLKEDYFIEHVLYNNNYYGSSKNEISDDKVIILEPDGVVNFLKLNDDKIVVIVLMASEETRIQRMASRGDKKEDIERRITGDRNHFSNDRLSFANYIIETDNKTVDEIATEVYKDYQEKISK